MKITKKQIKDKISEVLDPELNISIVDLGLIYDILIRTDSVEEVRITMTLTTIGCPLFSMIEDEIKKKLGGLGIAKKNITLELTFDPPWSMEKMSEHAKAMLGI